MKNRVKSYLVFTSVLYRIAMYIGLPVMLVGLYCYLRKGLSGEASMVGILGILTVAEIISDNWMFGGIQAKDSAKLDFLRTSGRGMKVMQDALAMDLSRKFVGAVVVFVLCDLAVPDGMVIGVWSVLYLILVSYFFSVLGVLITRFFTMIWCNMFVSYVASFIGVLCCVIPGLPLGAAVWYDIFFAVIGLVISILAVKTAMKKVKAQYAG